jgi:hypothetical protein
MISEHLTDWLGLPVQLFDAARSEEGVTDYSGTIYRLALDWDAKVGLGCWGRASGRWRLAFLAASMQAWMFWWSRI